LDWAKDRISLRQNAGIALGLVAVMAAIYAPSCKFGSVNFFISRER